MVCNTADFFFSFKEDAGFFFLLRKTQFKEDDAVLCVRLGMSIHRRKFPKGLQGAMVSFKRVSCHSSSLVGHGPCRNSPVAVAYFS